MKRPLSACSCAALLLACAPAEAPRRPSPSPAASSASAVPTGDVTSFVFMTIDGRAVSSAGYRGRMTVIVFVATYDTASLAQARFVNSVFRRHTPRINALMLALEPSQNAPLVETFAHTLELGYDVALADEATIAGKGPFPGLHHVPALVLLDRDGREVWRHLGVTDARTLDDAITAHDAGPAPR